MTYPGTKQLHRGCTEMSLRKRWMLKAGEQGIGELRDTWCTKMDVFFLEKVQMKIDIGTCPIYESNLEMGDKVVTKI